ncbi:APC family permease [Micromonospora antibiotica]|uniref:APC family permease n=1 Tax=Micromonospora antibiotica TaxID=2807623 RepID=A0ABS3V6M1_9ACTN|nr:APC family permease [Micromonospora antibiotica]MBO4161253.1 APC family permease [Micromonospora antibiotica]
MLDASISVAAGTDDIATTGTDPRRRPASRWRARRSGRAVPGRDRLSVLGGLAALSLDAMASVSYGPEAIVLVLAAAGGVGLGFTLPVTLAITGLLAVLVFSYRQVIAAFPDGGGAYAVAKRHLSRRTSLVAAASLVVDYVLNVAVSVAAGVAAWPPRSPRCCHTRCSCAWSSSRRSPW